MKRIILITLTVIIIIVIGYVIYLVIKSDPSVMEEHPVKFNLISSFIIKEGSGPYWAHPVINNGVLYLRHGEALMAFNIKK